MPKVRRAAGWSGIGRPTAGTVHVKGRVSALIELGAGFHPEISGRENIFMNGALLGMKRTEIVRKFDEIVAFAEIEKFIDTPVKRYSSGMYVRLAFAVAALDLDHQRHAVRGRPGLPGASADDRRFAARCMW